MFDEQVLRHAPWSFSKIGSLEKCKRQYHRTYVLKMRGADSGPEARIGVMTHRMLEHALQADTMPTDELFDAAATKEKLSVEEADVARTHLSAIDRFIRFARTFMQHHGKDTSLIEHKMAIAKDFSPCEFFGPGLLRGVIDWGVLTRANDLVIFDHKTGKPKPLDQYSVQLNIYRLFGAAHYPVRSIQCAIHHVATGRVEWTKPWTRERIERELRPWLAVYLNKQSRKLQMIDEGNAAPETGWPCGYCGHLAACEEGQVAEVVRAAKKKAAKPTINI